MLKNKMFLTTINLIPNPIIVTSGKEIIVSNDNFIDFFNYKDLKEFKKYNACVCNLFIQHKNYFSLNDIDEETLWTNYVYKETRINKKDALVSILDKGNEPAVFEITIDILEEYDNYYIIVFTDITSAQDEKQLLEKMAYYDHLTKIYNRQMFNTLMLKEKENQKRYGDTLTQLITKHLRTNDIFARWGGEEFLILMPRTSATIAYNKANELREIIEQYSDNIIPHFTVSFGVTEIKDTDIEQSCFIRVDEALYKAKEKRNNVVQF